MRSSTDWLDFCKTQRIAVVAGGRSNERDVSLSSGRHILESLQKQSYQAYLLDPKSDDLRDQSYDLAFNALHGEFGEDGVIQGFFESMGIPYTGCGVFPASLGYNKPLFKQWLNAVNIPTARFEIGSENPKLLYPFVAKPINCVKGI